MLNLNDAAVSVVEADIAGLRAAEKNYGDSWKKRGGVGAYMMLARKADRLIQVMPRYGSDLLRALKEDTRAEGVIDDLRDLRRYIMLIQAEKLAEMSTGTYLSQLDAVADADISELFKILDSFPDPRSEGEGLAAWIIFLRFFRSLEQKVESYGWDVFRMNKQDVPEGLGELLLLRLLAIHIEVRAIALGYSHDEVKK